jgi:simple sugar transport system substrate-binding protein
MKTFTIATVVKVKNGHAWFDRMEIGIKRFQADTGHTTLMLGPPEADENLQIQAIEQAIEQGVDALCVVPIFPQALELVLGKARRQGIVVISHEASNQRNADYDIEPFNNAAYGSHLMDHLAHYMNEEGQYAMLLGSLTSQTHSEWAKAALARQQEQYPRMGLITRKIEDHDDVRLAHDKTAELLTAYPDLKGVLGIDMTATAGAGESIEEKKLQAKVIALGTGLVSACRQHLLSGATKLISCWDPADAGYVMNKLAVMTLEGETISNGIDLGVSGYHHITLEKTVLYGSAMVDITKENMVQYDF